MLYDDVLKTQKEIRDAVKRCELDYALLSRSLKDVNALCAQLADQIEPLLLDQGFLRKGRCFFRIHGDWLIQIVGIQQESRIVFGIYVYTYPLFEVSRRILDTEDSIHYLIGTTKRERDFIIYARTIENIAGIGSGIPFLQSQLELDLPMKAECLLLEEKIIPILNACTTGVDAVKLNDDPKQPYLKINQWDAFSFHLRERMYSECAAQIDEMIGRIQSSLEYLQNPELTEWQQHKLKMSDEEMLQWKERVRKRADPVVEELSMFRELKSAIEKKDEGFINHVMNNATAPIYDYLATLNKGIRNLYPIEKYLRS